MQEEKDEVRQRSEVGRIRLPLPLPPSLSLPIYIYVCVIFLGYYRKLTRAIYVYLVLICYIYVMYNVYFLIIFLGTTYIYILHFLTVYYRNEKCP